MNEKIGLLRLIGMLVIALSLSFIALFYLGCSSSENDEDSKIDSTQNTISLPETTPESVWKYITQDNPYTKWNTFDASYSMFRL